MPSVVAKFEAKVMKFDQKKFSDKLQDQMSELMWEGAKVFVEKTAEKVPVWSGMAKGSLLPLANQLGLHIKVTPVTDAPDRVSEGSLLARGASYFKNDSQKFSFRFRSAVRHFAILDDPTNDFSEILKYFHLKTMPPWEAVSYGLSAYSNFVSRNKRKYAPKILDIVTTKKVTYT